MASDAFIVTNGDEAARLIAEAGIAPSERIEPWRDILHEGPVPGGLAEDAFIAERARFLAEAFGRDAEHVAASLAGRNARLKTLPADEPIEIWLEHDLYDQLQLVEILSVLGGIGRDENVFLVQSDDYLAHQDADTMTALATHRRFVQPEMFALAAIVWDAVRAPTPGAVATIVADGDNDLAALPWLRPALRRWLQELAEPASGLTRTQRLILETLSERGATQAGELFRTVAERDEPSFMGDLSFYRVLDELGTGDAPAIAGWGGRQDAADAAAGGTVVSLTDFAPACLDSRADLIVENGLDRWWGGTHLDRAHDWRWDGRALLQAA